MNLKTKKIAVFVFVFSFTVGVCFGQNNSSSQYLIENKFRMMNIEKDQLMQSNLIKDMSIGLEEQKKVILDLQNQNALRDTTLNQMTDDFAYKNTLVTWGLTILAILVTFFGVIIPIVGFFFGRKMKEEVDSQSKAARDSIKTLKEESEKEISKFIQVSKERITSLENNAQLCINMLKQYENDGKKISQNLNELIDNIKLKGSMTDEEKKVNIEKAQAIKTETGVTIFETDMAKALELYYKNDYEPALSMFRAIIRKYHEITLDTLSSLYYQMAFCYSNLDNHQEAINYNLRSLEIDPYDVYTLNNIAVEYQKIAYTKCDDLKNEYFEKAIKCLEKAIKITPNNSLTWSNLGNLYDDIHNYTESENAYKKAIDFDESYITPYKNLIEYYLINNNYSSAYEYLNKIKSTSSANEPIILILEVFLKVVQNQWGKSLEDTFAELEKSIQANPEGMKSWSFDYLKSYIQMIDEEAKDFLNKIIVHIEDYILMQKK